jgi:dolichol kinase
MGLSCDGYFEKLKLNIKLKGNKVALRKEEINRKLLHLMALLMPAGIFYLPYLFSMHYYISVIILGILLVGSVLIEHLRFKNPAIQKIFYAVAGSMLREEEANSTTGSTYVIGAALMCSLLFYKYPQVAFMVLFMFILGDAIAAIVGMSIGRIKIGKKSLEGSLACFTLCMILLYGLFPFFPGILDQWGGKMPFLVAVGTSLAITVFELIPLRLSKNIIINDNLAVPVIAGYTMIGLLKLL